MRLGILADTHNELVRTRVAVRMLLDAGAEALVHCGDLASPPIVVALAVVPAWFVFGNHDADMAHVLQKAAADFGPKCLEWGGVFEWGGRKIGLSHGHLPTDTRRVLGEQPDFLFSGHSHMASDRLVGTVRRINPGALHRAEEYTVALLEVTSGELRSLRVAR